MLLCWCPCQSFSKTLVQELCQSSLCNFLAAGTADLSVLTFFFFKAAPKEWSCHPHFNAARCIFDDPTPSPPWPCCKIKWVTSDFWKSYMAMEETNIAPENRPLVKDIPTGNHHFYGRTVSPREGKFPFAILDCLRGSYKHESTKRNESNHHDPYGTNKGQISSSFFRFSARIHLESSLSWIGYRTKRIL